ncbi:MAG: hypothetical protein MAG715_00425 [Methanonatronarchaeales archaeon]|nr:hypothetical protein [Methanonatronarchaeales archaeon]
MTENPSQPGNGPETSGDASDSGNPPYGGRDGLLEALVPALEEAKRKVESGRVYDKENERVRQKWIRTLAYTVNVANGILKDRDLEELRERIEALEEQDEKEEVIRYE